MGLFKRLRNKHNSEIVAEIKEDDNSCIIKDDNSVEMKLKLFGQDTTFNTSVDFLERFSQRKDNPESCRREPTDDEVKLSTNDDCELFYKQFGWDKQREYFNLRERETLAGFNYFVMPKADYDEAVRLYNNMKEEARKREESFRLLREGLSFEQSGDLDNAIIAYQHSITTDLRNAGAYERLMKLYHKLKRTDDEIQIVREACYVFPDDEKYRIKLNKLLNHGK